MKGKKKTPYDIYMERSSQPDYRPLASIADSFVVFVVLLEDCAFFKHKRGYDLKLIWLAIKNYLRGWGTFGGSTITQQLVKNLYFTFEKRIARKIRELFYAAYFEKYLTKEQILELYINTIYYDNGQYGICRASRFYFNREPAELTGNQAFFLASILPVVGLCNPLYCPEQFMLYRNRKLFHIPRAELILPPELAVEILQHGPDCLDEDLCRAVPETDRYNAPGPMVNERFGPGGWESLTDPKEAGAEEKPAYSPLVSYIKPSPHHSGHRTHSIDRITPHCVCKQWSAEELGEWFFRRSVKTSSNYGIDRKGRVGLYVGEQNCSHCSSSPENDQRAVTIECASEAEEPFTMNEAVYRTLIALCIDICERSGKKKLLWLADKDAALRYTPAPDEMLLTVHRWFASKSCPGEWLYSRLGELARTVTDALSASEPPA